MKFFKKYYPYIFLALMYFSYLWPNLLSLDRIGNQWLHLSIVNLTAFLTIVCFKKTNNIKEIFSKSLIARIWILFLSISLISIFFADNTPESIITFNQYFTIVLSFYLIQIFTSEIKSPIKFVYNLVLLSLFFDLIFSLIPIIKDLNTGGFIVPRSMEYKGLSANINIISFMMALKLPLAIDKLLQSKKSLSKGIFSILIILVIYTILAMGTRGAYIALFFNFIFTILRSYFDSNLKFILKLKNILFFFFLFFISIISNIVTTPKSNVNSIERASTISIDTNDGSVNQRLRYYKQGLNHLLNNPIMGVGAGNWKLISIEYDKNEIEGFTVPFHAHNDFIQIGAELGMFGLLSYLSIFIIMIFNLIKKVLTKDRISLIILFSIAVFTLDSLLNFPIARPISIITFLFLITMFEIINSKGYEK